VLMLRALVVVLAAAWALPAGAETYKWLDERGVVNYSNSPPPIATAGKKLERIDDRLSTYQSDPVLLRVAALRAGAPRPDYAEMEWLQRQRIMAEQQAYAMQQCDPRLNCSPGYLPSYYYPYLPVAFVHRPALVRPTFFLSQPSRARGSMMFR